MRLMKRLVDGWLPRENPLGHTRVNVNLVEYHVNKWFVFCFAYKKTIICIVNASPQKIVTDKAAESEQEGELIVRRIVKERVKFDCVIEPKLNPSNKLQKRLWEYSADNVTYGPLPAGVRRLTRTRIVIEKLNKTHQGYYRCSLNNQSIIALLRVKGRWRCVFFFNVSSNSIWY